MYQLLIVEPYYLTGRFRLETFTTVYAQEKRISQLKTYEGTRIFKTYQEMIKAPPLILTWY